MVRYLIWAAAATLTIGCGGGGGGTTDTDGTGSTMGPTQTESGPTTMSSETSSTEGPTTAGPTTEGPTTAGPTSNDPTTAGPTTDGTTAGPTTDPGTSTDTTDTTTGAGDDSTLCASQAEGLFFPADAIWYHDASSDPVAPDSAAITQWMVQDSPPNGWGTGTMRIDFSITAIDAPAGTEKRAYELDNDYYYSPDCDVAPIPLPPGGVVEDYPQDAPPADSFEGYDCSGYAEGADCHMIVVSRSEQRLYEVYHATLDDQDQFTAGCLALWDTSKTYDLDGRGQQCTSADAAGFPIAPLLFSAEEIEAGEINHAIRFILPNSMIRAKKYVAPATHGTNTTGPATSIPYGGHMRLRADYPIENLSPGAQVIARAMQKYGMYMSDGGNIALTAQSDVYGCATWDSVGVDPQSLSDLKATDFEVIDHGPTIDVTYECERTPIME